MEQMIKEYKDITDSTSSKYLKINSCGKQASISKKVYTILRSKGRSDYHFLYITNGTCEALHMNKTYTLRKGDLIFYKPHEKQMYTFGHTENSESYYIHFTGIGVEELIKRANLRSSGVYHIGASKEILVALGKLIREFSLQKQNNEIFCEAYMMEFLGIVSRLIDNSKGGMVPKNYEKIYNVLEYMYDNFQNEIDIDKHARECNLSRGRFVHLFKEVTNLSPYRYQLEIRIDKAKYYLKNTDLNISETANAVGFDDPLYFSRLFKKRVGVNPTAYRELKN